MPRTVSKRKIHSTPVENTILPELSLHKLQGATKSPLPAGIIPMAFKLSPEPFNNQDWQFEIKWDGFRTLAYLDKGKVQLRSRNDLSFNKRFSAVSAQPFSFNKTTSPPYECTHV